MIASVLLTIVCPVTAQIVHVDNADSGFSVLSGNWTLTSSTPGHWGTGYRYRATTGYGSTCGEVEFNPDLPVAGNYEVAVWYTQGSNRATDAPYTVHYDGGSQTVDVNQQIDGEQWVILGTYPFAAGTTGRVTLSNEATPNVVIADAVRFRETGTPAGWRYAGLRVSRIPFDPFPDPEFFTSTSRCMATKVPDSTPCLVWIVSLYWSGGDIGLNFPNPTGQSYPHMYFSSTDKNEAHLDYFDSAGVSVWLQVEPGDADMEDLIDVVLMTYRHHSCVIGFGVDVEWFNTTAVGNGRAVTDAEAQAWDAQIKSYDPAYRLFLKHYMQSKMPPTVRDDLLFVDDSQGFSSLSHMTSEFASWGAAFSPAEVGFQYGYPNDRPWWSSYGDPAGTVADAIYQSVPNASSFFWVDFTIEEIVPVGDAPTIITPPTGHSVGAGAAAMFSVTAAADGEIVYQWQRDGVDLADDGHHSGVATPTLTISDASRTDEGGYRCVVANGCGSTISAPAELVVVATGDIDADGDLDLLDYAAYADCLSGPDVAPDPTPPTTAQKCLDVFDLDVDDDVDLLDFKQFAIAFDNV